MEAEACLEHDRDQLSATSDSNIGWKPSLSEARKSTNHILGMTVV